MAGSGFVKGQKPMGKGLLQEGLETLLQSLATATSWQQIQPEQDFGDADG